MSEKLTRRNLLKASCGATASLIAVSGNAVASSNPAVENIKSDPSNPIRKKDIHKAREIVFNKSDTQQEQADTFIGEIPDLKDNDHEILLGYGISMKDGIPEERYEYISSASSRKLEDSNELRKPSKEVGTSVQQESPEDPHTVLDESEVSEEQIDRVHSKVDQWAESQYKSINESDEPIISSESISVSASKSYTWSGSMSTGKEVHTDKYAIGPTNPVGYIQNWTDTWKEANPGDETVYLIEQSIKQYPGIAYSQSSDNYSVWRNWYTEQTIDWDSGDFQDVELKSHKPDTSVSGKSIDTTFNLGVNVGDNGPSGGLGLSVDLDTNKIGRDDKTDPQKDRVEINWYYPIGLGTSEARSKADLFTASYAKLGQNADSSDSLCSSKFNPTFSAKEHTGGSTVLVDYHINHDIVSSELTT